MIFAAMLPALCRFHSCMDLVLPTISRLVPAWAPLLGLDGSGQAVATAPGMPVRQSGDAQGQYWDGMLSVKMDRRCWGAQMILLLVTLLGGGFGESLQAQAQTVDTSRQRIGDWRLFPSFNETVDVAAGADFIAYATRTAVLLRYHNGEIRVLDKTNALSQANPRQLAINPQRPSQLLIAYEDGALEVLEEERSTHYTRAIPNAQITGRRDINRLRYINATTAIVTSAFGYLIYDVEQGLFRDDVRFTAGVNDAAVLDGHLFLATATGLRVLRDYRSQSTLRDTIRYENLSVDLLGGLRKPCLALEVFEEWLYVGFPNEFYRLRLPRDRTAEIEGPVDLGCGRSVDFSSTSTGLLALIAVSGNCGREEVLYRGLNSGFVSIDIACGGALAGVALAPNGAVGLAGDRGGSTSGILLLDEWSGSCRSINAAGPGFQEVFDVAARDGVVAIAAGGLTPQEDYTYNRRGISVLRDGRWTNYDQRTRPILVVQDSFASSPADFIAVALDRSGRVFGGAYFEGLYAFAKTGPAEDEAFNETNSTLRTHVDDPLRVRIAGLTFDDDGNLWVSNYGARRGISVRTPAGEWASFDMSSCGLTRKFRDLVVSQRFDGSRIVYAIETDRGVVALDPGADLLDPADDRCARVNTNNGLSNPDVRSLALDRQGDVWLGTNDGIAVINGDVFAENFQVFVPASRANIDNLRGSLFEGTAIQAIAVDGGNRKWFGTANGLFLVDSRDNEQLAAYDEFNSPLPDANVKTLAYDGSTGVLWIGGDNGLAALQTESTTGATFSHQEEVEVYPQPVRPEYTGPISIRGLGQDSDVKITDMQGRLVFETSAIGGAATWDGMDYTGRRPASGIYLVWATVTPSLGKPATVVGKIALLR